MQSILDAHRQATREAVLATSRLLRVPRGGGLRLEHALERFGTALLRLNQATPDLRPEPAPLLPPCPAPDLFAQGQQEVWGSKGLLAEIIKRAANDWVLYRMHRDLHHRQMAEEAYTWLFEEAPGHASWILRIVEKRQLTAFITICEVLDLDVDKVRAHIRQLTPQDVRNAGRPPERRRWKRPAPCIEESTSGDKKVERFG